MNTQGSLEEVRAKFRSECEAVRPDLHRFCARMVGSLTEGEDVVQDTLAVAFYKLGELDAWTALRAWMFRIAYRKCLDLQRARRRLDAWDDEDDGAPNLAEPGAEGAYEAKALAVHALTAVVEVLPVRERACVVLKDVLDHSLEEIAAMTDTTVGAVKAALHRGRAKLRAHIETLPSAPPARAALVEQYVARFNARDWEGVRALLADDARLEVVDRFEGPFGERYFCNYASLARPWKLELARVEGRDEVVHFRQEGGAWRPIGIVLLRVRDGKVCAVRDYVHVAYLLEASRVTSS